MQALHFDNAFVRNLPPDPEVGSRLRQVHGALYSRVQPTPVADPRIIAWSQEVADLLGIGEDYIRLPEFAQVFSGNALLEGMEPYAANYGGHQFGNWAGQLGDGRAITLGEVRAPSGTTLELQLKGAGRTPYSRTKRFACTPAMWRSKRRSGSRPVMPT